MSGLWTPAAQLAPEMVLGSLQPTFQVAPAFHSNAAGELVDFMDQIGRPMAEEQQLVMHLWCGERADGSWAAFELFEWLQRQNGKSYPALARELGGLFVLGEQLLIHTAHNSVAVMNQWKLTLETVEGNADLTRRIKRISKKDGEEGIELMSGAELQFRVRSGRGKGRSLSGNFIGIDEALYLKQSDLDAFGPTTLARANAQVAYMSTPPEDADAPIMQIRQRAHDGAPRMAGCEWVNPRGADLNDPRVIARVNPAYGRRISHERIMVDLRGMLGAEGWARECGGIWPDPATGKSIDPAQWARLQDSGSQRGDGATVAYGVSVAPMRNIAAIALWSTRPDGQGHGRLVDFRLGTDWIVTRLVELLATLNPALVGMTKGVAESIGPELAEAGLAIVSRPPISPKEDAEPGRLHHGNVIPLAGGDTKAACGQIIDAVRNAARILDTSPDSGGLRVVPSADLDASVAGASTKLLGDGITWVRKGMGTEAAPIEALTIARWIHASFGQLVEEDDYDVLDSVY